MGCDIHFYIELKTENGWELYSSPKVRRDYKLFEKLAGVRGEESEAISLPKGLPSDISFLVKKEYESWHYDAHSESWLSLNEIVELSEWWRENHEVISIEYDVLRTYLNGNSFAGLYKYPDEYPEWVEDVRFVFWFDN